MNLFIALASTANNNILQSLQFWNSDGFSVFINHLIYAIVVLLIGWIVLKIILNTLKKVLERSKKLSDLLQDYFLKIVSILGWVIVIVTTLAQLGIDMAPMIAGLGITGVVLGLALKDSISNFFAGFMIILNNLFRKGDFVQLGSLSGTVKSMDLMSVKLATPDNKNVTISNNIVWGAPVINFSDIDKRRVDMSVGVPYDCDLKVAKQVFVDLISSYPEVLKDMAVTVEIAELADSSINFVIRPWVLPADYWTVYFRFNSEITPKLAEKGIYLPFPQLDVHLDKN
ncbi:MAG: mechanosensitive ion channel family protein [Sphaerochaetaceae bacterium]|nr:mechanosensitive ion channel family protein [Sphaerochaetaceae bacterium]MDC7243060.1 mechanosensitive ion channel family protein [Sphaerochaetaceae bacterium]MDC7248786.1 mechanosensitive ion channel family protein [Sphaerochaetaceae bacterium]